MSLQEIFEGLQSVDPHAKFIAAQNARIILSTQKFPPISSFITAGVIPNLVSCLTCNDNVPLQFEACSALAIIASGTYDADRILVDAGAIPIFIHILNSPHVNVIEQAVLALGNIAGECLEFRDCLIKHGVVPPLLSLLTPDIPEKLCHNIIRTLCNLCIEKNSDPLFEETVNLCLPALADLICHSDSETVNNTCWTISYIIDGSNERIQKVIESGFVPKLVKLLNKNEIFILPAIKCIGNIAKSGTLQSQVVIDAGALDSLGKFITHEKAIIGKEACTTISNITAGDSNQIQAVIDHGLMEGIINLLYHHYDEDVKGAAVQAVVNLTISGTLSQIMYLLQADIMLSLFDLLYIIEPKMLTVVLSAINNILNATIKVDALEVAQFYIELCNGLDKLIKVVEHEDDEDLCIHEYGKYEEADENCNICNLALHLIELALKSSYLNIIAVS